MTTPEVPLARKRLLILTFSPIASDARVLKQVELFRHEYDVTTCAIGEFSVDGVEELERAQGWRGLVSRGRVEALPARLRGGMPAETRGAPCRRWIIRHHLPTHCRPRRSSAPQAHRGGVRPRPPRGESPPAPEARD